MDFISEGDGVITENPVASAALAAGVAATASGNSATSSVLDDPLVPLPNFFGLISWIFVAQTGQPRATVRVAPFCAYFVSIYWPMTFAVLGYIHREEMVPALQGVALFAVMAQGMTFALPSLYAYFFTALRPDTGSLARLGASKAMITTSKLRTLNRWKYALCIPTAGIVGFGLIGPLPLIFLIPLANLGVVEHDLARLWPIVPALPCICHGVFLGYPAAAAWYLGMKVAVVIAQSEVHNVITATTPEALADDQRWSAEVGAPAIRLATVGTAPCSAILSVLILSESVAVSAMPCGTAHYGTAIRGLGYRDWASCICYGHCQPCTVCSADSLGAPRLSPHSATTTCTFTQRYVRG
eukprot:COSAG02_NODE_1019_length_15171_cov_7.663482_5_plen_355_part_00